MIEGGIKQISAGIIGAGAWGKAFSQILIDSGWATHVWSREVTEIQSMANGTLDIRKATDGVDLIVIALPCAALREILPQLRGNDLSNMTILSLTKGLEAETLLRPSQIIREILGDVHVAVLSGPNLADELAQKLPAIGVVASDNLEISHFLASQISNGYFKVRSSGDVVGLEVASVYKNILAIAIGLIRGSGRGENLAAAVITAGLKEMLRVALKSGAHVATIYGPAGLGDLIATSSSGYSRNYSLGRSIAQKKSVDKALAAAHQTVEGVGSVAAILALAKKLDVETPIADIVGQMLAGVLTVAVATNAITAESLR